jgi:mannose-1-phosphate guanylyltransferase
MSTIEGFWAVIPAGGAGTRLWPLSRSAHPKFLHDLVGAGRTLIQATVDRVSPLAADRVVVITGAKHAAEVTSQLPEVPAHRILAEPSPRDSMAAIAWAAAEIERRDPDGILGSFAADHVIPDPTGFHAAVTEAAGVARQGYLVTIGIEPTFPATGFGYIQMGPPLEDFPSARHVRQFVEKPDAERAAAYLATNEFRWNAGMFVVRATVLLDLLAQWHPDLAASARALAAEPERIDEIWPTLERIAIDHAVAEPAADIGRVAVVPGNFSWDDVGDFSSLAEILPDGAGEPWVVGNREDTVFVDASGLVLPRGGRLIAVVGLENVVVVDTGDAILVTSRERSQDVKQVVDQLKGRDRSDLV